MEVKTISSEYIVQRVLANHKINNSNWINDSKDWIPQAIRFIGKHVGFQTKVCTNVYVDNYHTCYPIDMEGLLAVMYKGSLLPLGSNLGGAPMTKSFSDAKTLMPNDDITLELNKLNEQKETLIGMYATTPTDEIATKINDVAGRINSLEIYVSAENQTLYGRQTKSGDYYNTKIDRLQTSFETGYIDIIYVAFPIDEQGFILVLDNEYYIQAIEWYVLLMLVQQGYKHPLFTWEMCYSMFWGGNKLEPLGWRAKAANNARIPSIQDAERFTRMWEQHRLRRTLPIQLFDRTEQVYGLLY
jgi:5-hydroxyisourate hydrolase-like protein (transthyretin family)